MNLGRFCRFALVIFLLTQMVACSQEITNEYIYSYDQSCEHELVNLKKTLERAGIYVSYEIVSPKDDVIKGIPWSSIIRIQVGEAYSQDALVGLLNNFQAECGPSRKVRLPANILNADGVNSLVAELKQAASGGPHLVYIENGTPILVSGE
ncbi:hypothetical protein [Microbulbifer agarilyticus]|uniref:hypothetical protein n=1 Tax=Microbulbifer agarilyticus TaxID=260552 RepID=UPI0012F8489B|nr:hypothetical protein [Microbulbifer agarilyticus]